MEEGEDKHVIGNLKRRLHSLKSNLVELNIGGIDASDRDALRDLVEDAVLNCRSAAANGVGYGANFMGVKASIGTSNEIYVASKSDNIYTELSLSIANAYKKLVEYLYSSTFTDETKLNEIIDKMISVDNKNGPYNIRTGEFDGKVKSSIESDIIILDAVSKIVGMMATCNQFIVPTPMHNIYDIEEND